MIIGDLDITELQEPLLNESQEESLTTLPDNNTIEEEDQHSNDGVCGRIMNNENNIDDESATPLLQSDEGGDDAIEVN